MSIENAIKSLCFHSIGHRPEKNQLRESYKAFIGDWVWDLHATLHISNSFSPHMAEGLIRKYFLNGVKRLYGGDLKFGGVFIIPCDKYTGVTHAHVLLISDHSWRKNFETLDDEELRAMEDLWVQSCRITKADQWDNNTITNYFTKNKNLPINQAYRNSNTDFEDIIDGWGPYWFRPELLKKLKTLALPELRPEYFKEPTRSSKRTQRTPIIKL